MSGHSKWKTIKVKKGALDAKRGKIFSKILRELVAAVRGGGPSADANPRLRTVMDKAREANMPLDNIKRAIAKASGEGKDAVHYEEVVYEGYGPAGAAVLVEALTDNKNRTSSELKTIFSRNGGSMGTPGSVAWMFQAAGLLTFDKKRYEEEALMSAALEAGAEDFKATEHAFEIVTAPAHFETVRDALKAKGLEPTTAEQTRLPKSTVALDGKNAETMIKLLEALEDHDDVQNVFGNYDISEKLLETLVGSAA